MDQESYMVKQIRSLDSDMQTLVYENYNKFISATGKRIGDIVCNAMLLNWIMLISLCSEHILYHVMN